MKIYLIGMPGSGKSSLGNKLAEKLIPLLKKKNIKTVVLVSTNATAYVEKMDVFNVHNFLLYIKIYNTRKLYL